ncbi:MAG: pilin [Parcubacteria group bacterium]
MKIKIIVLIFCLGLFFGINHDANAVSCGAGNEGTCAADLSCPPTTNPFEGTCPDGQRCCKPGELTPPAVTTVNGCCVVSSGNCLDTIGTACSDGSMYAEKKCSDVAVCAPDTPPAPSAPKAAAGSTAPTTFENPITANSIEDLLGNLLKALQGVVALIAIIMIVVGGLMYMFAGVDEKMVETAKKTIGGAVIGLAIVFAAPAFLKEILIIVGGPSDAGLLSAAPRLKTIAENVLSLLLSIVGILGIIGLIIGGGFYLTSYGDEERIKKGKDIIAASLFGLIIAMAALIIVKQIAALFGK